MTIETPAKVMAPQVTPFAVFRTDLVRRLDEAVRSKVTLAGRASRLREVDAVRAVGSGQPHGGALPG